MDAGRRSTRCWWSSAGRARASCGSRAATRSCSAAAARRPRRWPRPGARSRSCPAVTAGIAAPAYAGIPVTHRDDASAVAFDHRPRGSDQAGERARLGRRWPRFPGTLVLLHGRSRTCRRSPAASDRRAAARCEPVAVDRARHAARPARASPGRWPTSPSASPTPASGRRRSRWSGPVARLRDELAWLESPAAVRPLGRRHARAGAGKRACRAAVPTSAPRSIETPAIRIEPRARRDAARDIGSYELVVVTSPNGARAADGPGRGRALARRRQGGGDRPRHRARAGAARDPGRRGPAALDRRGAGGGARVGARRRQRVLVARAAEARDVLPEALAARGARSTSSLCTTPSRSR